MNHQDNRSTRDKRTTYLFVDTNIFLHYRFFIEIPWGQLFASDYKLVICMTVLSELDKHKRNPSPRTAERAKKVAAKLLSLQTGYDTYPIEFVLTYPRSDTYDSHHLSREQQDDQILATVIEFQHGHPHDEVLLVTNDTGNLLRGPVFGIKSVSLTDEYELENLPSESDRENKKLRTELEKLKRAIPDISLTFKDGQTKMSFNIPSMRISKEDFVLELLKEEVKRLPPLEHTEYEGHSPAFKIGYETAKDPVEKLRLKYLHDPHGYIEQMEASVKNYNAHLKTYLNAFEQFLALLYEYEEMRLLAVPIDLLLINEGGAPGLNVEVNLGFPIGIRLFNNGNLPDKPVPPQPPYRPKNSREFTPEKYHPKPSTFLPQQAATIAEGLRPRVEKSGEAYNAEDHFGSIKHFKSVSLSGLIAVFPSYKAIRSFQIAYSIVADNVADRTIGELVVKISQT